MPRIMVIGDDGEVFWNESVRAADFSGEHFRCCLADRLGWAVSDAEGPAQRGVKPFRPTPDLGGDAASELVPPPAQAIAA